MIISKDIQVKNLVILLKIYVFYELVRMSNLFTQLLSSLGLTLDL